MEGNGEYRPPPKEGRDPSVDTQDFNDNLTNPNTKYIKDESRKKFAKRDRNRQATEQAQRGFDPEELIDTQDPN